VGERNLSGGQGHVQERNIAEDGNENGLEAKSKVTEAVDHTLLGKGEISSLADHQVSPLDANNRDQVASLSVFEGLGRVANRPSVGLARESVESGEGVVSWAPSAVSIGLRASVRTSTTSCEGRLNIFDIIFGIGSVRVVETDINFCVHASIPTE
jgi:hypothetical protein